MSNIEQIIDDRLTPRWARDLYRLLPIKSQFIFSGNIRDVFLIKNEDPKSPHSYSTIDFFELLWKVLQAYGFSRIDIYDPIEGMAIYPPDGKTRQTIMPPDNLANNIRERLEGNERVAIVMDFASRLARDSRLFAVCHKLASSLSVRKGKNETFPFYTPIVWLFDNDADIPVWYGSGNHRVHRLDIPRPDLDQRQQLALMRMNDFKGYNEASAEEKEAYSKIYASMSDGFSLSEMTDIGRLSKIVHPVALKDIDDAVRSYKAGNPALESPWQGEGLKERIKRADSDEEKFNEDDINRSVLGQRAAVRHALDILKRSIMGMTGAQTNISNNRPRGVLFLAGPTGVGKTELAKCLTKSLFGDPKAYIRFDMSEFSQEHSDARLLGAPPGYVGYEGGGELVNAIRQKPFSLLLFDEIEKANGKILDKFLQILEDGRITSGKGETVYFTECVIVFTSNLGIMEDVRNDHGEIIDTVTRVQWNEEYEKVYQEVMKGIKSHFTSVLKRPELLNRLGNNIVVFDFIRPEVADEIITVMLDKISGRLRDEHNAGLVIDDAAVEVLRANCKRDLSHGGRGIGNCLETMLINPLSRNLFELPPIKGKTATVSNIRKMGTSGADTETYELDLTIK